MTARQQDPLIVPANELHTFHRVVYQGRNGVEANQVGLEFPYTVQHGLIDRSFIQAPPGHLGDTV